MPIYIYKYGIIGVVCVSLMSGSYLYGYNHRGNIDQTKYNQELILQKDKYIKDLANKQQLFNQFKNDNAIQMENKENEMDEVAKKLHSATTNLANCKLTDDGLRRFLDIATNTDTSRSNPRLISGTTGESASSSESMTCQDTIDSAVLWSKWYRIERNKHIQWIEWYKINNPNK